MAQGSLMFPLGYMPLDDSGNPVPAGKLTFSRTGTATAQDTYSDSALQSANANPVVLDSAGRVSGKVYGNPATGFDYRVKFSTSADVQIWVHDDVVVDGADTATLAEGSFTGTLTGMSGATTGTVFYKITAASDGTGKVCTLYLSTTITGTSNTTAMTMTGLPAAAQPTGSRTVLCVLVDNSNNVHSYAALTAASGTVGFATDDPLTSTGFTNSGTKGLSTGWSVTYAL